MKMQNLIQIMRELSIPRPNHSRQLYQTCRYLKDYLNQHQIQFDSEEFQLKPYKHFLVGVSIWLSAIALSVLLALNQPLAALVPALLIPSILMIELEFFASPISSIICRKGENIVIPFTAPEARRELIISAHYDSKTDFFNHEQRQKIYDWFIPIIAAGIIAPLLFQISKGLLFPFNIIHVASIVLGAILVIYWFLVFLAFGGYLFIKKQNQSPGVVDNAAAVAIILAIAEAIQKGELPHHHSNITLLLLSGEEVNMQGAHAYLKDRYTKKEIPRQLPLSLINLELIGQRGNMIAWRQNGVFLRFYDADVQLMEKLNHSVKAVTGVDLEMRGRTADDAVCFMARGIPSLSVGHSGLPGLGEGGFHSKHDGLERLEPDNLADMINVLQHYIRHYSLPLSFNRKLS